MESPIRNIESAQWNSSREFRLYTLGMVGFSVFLIFAVIAISYVIDPYALLSRGGLDIFPNKPDFSRNSRLSKTYAIVNFKPDLIVLGSSRTDHGIDPDYPLIANFARRPYNASIDGTNMVELATFFEHAIATGELKSAVIGLDFHLFANKPGISPDDRLILDSEHHNASLNRFGRWLKLSATTDAIKSCMATITGQQSEQAYDLRTGRRTETSFRERVSKMGGATRYFVQWERKEGPAYLAMAAARKSGPFLEEKAEHFAAFNRVLLLARTHGVDLKLFFSPMHARNAEVLAATGQWEDFENWKREIVRLVEIEAGPANSEIAWPIWDFSGYNEITTEVLPNQILGTGVEMSGYWDPSHYRKAVGDRILSILFGGSDRKTPQEFGVLLSGRNVEEHLSTIRADQNAYRRRHPKDVAAVQDLIRELRGNITSRNKT